ncbi:NAD(P)-dependent oxidoreductase [Candidatus Kaiserbacteria bacterium]|nr:NAD(P)-dependent oxidoreductase [Candidatus Kaiserbacteria bacterium]
MSKKRVLVTGATGFIGRHALQPLLERGFEVHAVYHESPADINVTWHKSDLLAEGAAEALCKDVRATHLLHFAWMATPGEFWSSPQNERWKTATIELVRAFQKHGGIRTVVAGSCAEYDWSSADKPLSEDAPRKPSTPYGEAKNDTRAALETFAKETSLSLGWGRIFFLYGPYEPPSKFVAYIINTLLAGERALLSPCKQIRDFLYVEDVADAFVTFLDTDTSGAVNIASGKPVALKDIALEIARQLGKEKLLSFGARGAPENEPPRLVADVSRLRDIVPWKKCTPLEKGIEETIAWWKANGSTSSPQDRA